MWKDSLACWRFSVRELRWQGVKGAEGQKGMLEGMEKRRGKLTGLHWGTVVGGVYVHEEGVPMSREEASAGGSSFLGGLDPPCHSLVLKGSYLGSGP